MAEEDRKLTRRACLTGAAATATLLGAGPVLAEGPAGLDPRLTRPPGQRRAAPTFRRIDLGK